MSLHSLKRDIARIKRKEGINFEKIDYEHALERHNARLDILYAEYCAPSFDVLDAVIKELNKSGINNPNENHSSELGNQARRESKKAREFLGDDTPERWKKDQETIVAYHLKLYGNQSDLESQNAFGSTPDEMWANYKSNIFASKDREEMSKRLSNEEKDAQRIKMEKKYGTPVRLHPDPTNYTYKYYVPEFAKGDPRWDLRRIFPYEDFPEHDGHSIIEL